nr:exosortase H-associated membrane protein [Paracidovorax cattleyae]
MAGYALLLPLQAFSLCMQLLMQLLLTAQFDVRALRVAQWQMEALVYGYQLGSLVVPTLAPILVWLWLDRAFVNEVVIGAWKRSLSGRATVPAPAPAEVPMAPDAAEGLAGTGTAVAAPAASDPDADTPVGVVPVRRSAPSAVFRCRPAPRRACPRAGPCADLPARQCGGQVTPGPADTAVPPGAARMPAHA